MKILHVIDYYYPELGYQITYLTKYMKQMGHEIYIVTSERYSPVIYEEDSMKKLLGNRRKKSCVIVEDGITIFKLRVFFEIGSTVWLRNFQETILLIKPDLIYVHGITTFSAIRIALLKSNFKRIKLVYQNYQISEGSFSLLKILYLPFKLFFSPFIMKKSDLFIAIATEAKKFAHEKIGISNNHIQVFVHGADPSVFYFDSRIRSKYREKYHIKSNDIVYIYTGKILPYKGIHILIDVGIKLIQKYNNIKILIIGGGQEEYIDYLKKKIHFFGLNENIIFLEPVLHKELFKFYSVSDVAVWPTSVTIASLEAMSCGLPIIISDVPAAIERAIYENGFVVHKGSSSELLKHMETLYLDKKLREKYGNNGRIAILKGLNWYNITKSILQSIEKIEND